MTPPPQLAEVHALLGRCLLGVQSCEVALKAILAAQTVTLSPTPAMDDRRTLGPVVEDLFGRFIVTGDWPGPPDDGPPIIVRVGLRHSAEDAAVLRDSLRTFVTMRNALVHQFVHKHDMHTAEGCAAAVKDLTETLGLIRQHWNMFRDWNAAIASAHAAMAEEIIRMQW